MIRLQNLKNRVLLVSVVVAGLLAAGSTAAFAVDPTASEVVTPATTAAKTDLLGAMQDNAVLIFGILAVAIGFTWTIRKIRMVTK